MIDAVCIDAQLLGTPDHLLFDDRGYSWCTSPPTTAWHVSGSTKSESIRCLDTVFALERISVDLFPPARWRSVANVVIGQQPVHTVPWKHVMPSREFTAFVRRLVGDIRSATANVFTSYYSDTWVPASRVFSSLRRMNIDAAKLATMVDGNAPALASLVPEIDGLAHPIVYDRMRTCTGRLVVSSGPQVLTLAKRHREAIVPSAPGRCICCADFAAMEARVFLYEAGHSCREVDMYAALMRDLFNNAVQRDAVKAAVLSELYGMSKHALGEKLGVEGSVLDEFVSTVKNYFNCRKLIERVKKQYIKHGFIRNRYGRRVDVEDPLDHILVNYYVQSTGCDVVLKGFASLLDELEPAGVKPLYLLHDAIFFDAPIELVKNLGPVKWVKVKGYVQAFPVRFEITSCTP